MRPGLLRCGVALLLALLGVILVPTPAAVAHEELFSSDPSEAGVLTALPSRAVLTFTGAVAEVHEVTVTGPDGSVVNGTPTLTGPEVRQNLWAGPDGAYTMTYDVLSSDGHEIAGEIHFEVGRGPVGADADAAAEASSSTADPDGGLTGVVVPAIVVLLSGACALVVWRRRRAPGTES